MNNYGMSMNYKHFSLPNLQRKMVATEIPVKYLRYKRSYKCTLHSAIFSKKLPVDRNCLLFIEPQSKFFHSKSNNEQTNKGVSNLIIYPDETFARSRYKSDIGRYIQMSPDWEYAINTKCYSNDDPFYHMDFGFHLFEFVDNTLDNANYGIKVFKEILLNNKVYKPLEAIKCGNMFDNNFERHSNIYKDRRVACLMPPTIFHHDEKSNRSIITPLIIDSLSGTKFRTILENNLEKNKLFYMPSHRKIQSGEIYLDVIDVSHLPSFDEIPYN